MSEKQKPPEICILINDTSQRNRPIAIWFRCGGTFDQYFVANLLLSLF